MNSFTLRGHHGIFIGRLVLTTCMQAQGAPVVDRCSGVSAEGRSYRGRAILLKPWKRGERSISARALVIGWFR